MTPIQIPCLVSGTLVRTRRGKIRVEKLRIGDRVVTQSGEAPVKWIGTRAYDARFVAGNPDAFPILIRQGALGEGTPSRDLYVSDNHALLVDGWLVEARLLVNGRSILRAPRWSGALAYFHVELERHDVFFAEGALVESYLDCGNRGLFQNAADFRQRYPEFKISDQVEWAGRLVRGPALDAIRARLTARAAEADGGDAERLAG